MSAMHSPTRKEFLKTAAAGTVAAAMSASSYARVIGANDRIRIGQIGCGNRGFGAHMTSVNSNSKSHNVETVAVCDVWKVHLDRAVAEAGAWYGRAPKATAHYEELLAMDGLDAVIIASPDHQHCLHLEAAAKAGKDAYCEKPLAMNMDELKSACDAVTEAGIVVQIGTQIRSSPGIHGCKKFFESGMLGKVSRVEQYRNNKQPNWYKRLSRLPIAPGELDWDEFLKPGPGRPFDGLQFAGWYGYREFCTGSIGQFMSHFIDTVHFITGAKYPQSAVALGGTYLWDDKYKFDCPDQIETTLKYPEGFQVHFCVNFGNSAGNRTVMYGANGLMDFGRSKPAVSGEGAYEKGPLGKVEPVKPVACADHMVNWLECLRSRKTPIAPIKAGHQHAVACILSDTAWLTGQRQVYDHKKREIHSG